MMATCRREGVLLISRDSPEEGSPRRLKNITLVPARCPCTAFEQTGKLCAHLKAVQLYVANGPIEVWEGE